MFVSAGKRSKSDMNHVYPSSLRLDVRQSHMKVVNPSGRLERFQLVSIRSYVRDANPSLIIRVITIACKHMVVFL